MVQKNIYIPLLRKESTYFYIFTALAVLVPFAAVFIPWMPEHETIATWFQRSGSAIVVFALLAESRAINVYNILNPVGFPETDFDNARKQYNKHPAMFQISSFILIAIGTLIWGYGDILFKCT
ncbi:MAG: hypothetical protein PSN44_00185 [Gammaproteobacteria bacterium]|nr:hypothetical protein [Gammaproteobacteria bacterium]